MNSGKASTCTRCGGERPLTFVSSYPYPCRACGYLCDTCMAYADVHGELPPQRRTST